MAAALAHPKLNLDSLGAASFQAERAGLGNRHELVQIEDPRGLGVFGPFAAGPLSPAHHHVLGPTVECRIAVALLNRLNFVTLKQVTSPAVPWMCDTETGSASSQLESST